MRLLDEPYTRTPSYGIRRMTAWLDSRGRPSIRSRWRGYPHNAIETIYPKPAGPPHPNVCASTLTCCGVCGMTRVNQVWSTAITAIRLPAGLCMSGRGHGLVLPLWAVMGGLDYDGCRLLSLRRWSRHSGSPRRPSLTVIKGYAVRGAPTSPASSSSQVEDNDMDGRGRALDHVLCRRIWQTIKIRRCLCEG